MTEEDLLRRVRSLVANPRRATSAAGWPGGNLPPSFDPAPKQIVEEARRRFGFAIPGLLTRLWLEVANGGIGPGYGIFGVEGGMTDDGVDMPLPDLFLAEKDEEPWIELIAPSDAARTFPICDWGCCTFSAIDCSSSDGNMLLFVDGVKRIDQQVTFAQWIEDWVYGIEVGADDYSRVKRRATWLPSESASGLPPATPND
ncbi:MAG: hypothetical protein U0Q16_08330 [Bryobacteraceae bacterium]